MNFLLDDKRESENGSSQEQEWDRLFLVHKFILTISSELDVSKWSFGILIKIGIIWHFRPNFWITHKNFSRNTPLNNIWYDGKKKTERQWLSIKLNRDFLFYYWFLEGIYMSFFNIIILFIYFYSIAACTHLNENKSLEKQNRWKRGEKC